MTDRMKELSAYLETLATVQSSGYKCNGEIAKALRELEELVAGSKAVVMRAEYNHSLFREVDGPLREECRTVNEQIFAAYKQAVNGTLYFERASGVSTSIRALRAIAPNVVYLEYGKDYSGVDVKGKVVFVDSGVELSRGLRPKAVIKIRAIDFTDGDDIYTGQRLRKATVTI